MKYVLSFILGVAVGAVVALLFAPSSGEELRAQIQTGAEAELKKAEAEWHKATADLHEKFDQTSEDIKDLIEHAKAKAEKVEAEPAVDVAEFAPQLRIFILEAFLMSQQIQATALQRHGLPADDRCLVLLPRPVVPAIGRGQH